MFIRLHTRCRHRKPVNEWVEKSIRLANRSDYLDRLHVVYPADFGPEREVDPDVLSAIQTAHRNRDVNALVRAMLDLERFPVGHPFAAFLKRKPELIERNPETIPRLGETFLRMPLSNLIALCMAPKAPNTKFGPMFRNWLQTLEYPLVPREAFGSRQARIAGDGEVVLLDGSDEELRRYANSELECAVGKGTDLVFRVGRTHVIGTAKWLGSPGGNQYNAFTEALRFIGGHGGRARRIAVL